VKPIFRIVGFAVAWLVAGGPVVMGAEGPGQSFVAARRHWAYQPVGRPVPPPVRSPGSVRTPVDAFLLAKLEAKGRTFAPAAARRTWLRRVTYDLIGLPPTAGETERFVADASAGAETAVVDRLLADPRYGERWGRHWLDVARYADTKDLVLLYGRDALRPYAYTYRDYVVRAYNADLPYDEFVRDQLAADLVEPGVEPWRLAALGFLTLGRLFDHNVHDQIDDQIDTVGRGLLGLTVACARCHDHKYDAVTSADYYGWYGVFASTERPYVQPLIEDPLEVVGGPAFEEQLGKARKELEDHIDAQHAALTAALRHRIGDYLARAATTAPDLTETAQFALSLTPDDFRPSLMLRTRRYLERRATPDDRVFGPWARLMALPEDGFPAKAAAVLAGLGNDANPLLLAALRDAAPTDRAAVARAYGKALVAAWEQSGKPTATAAASELAAVVAGPDGPLWFPRRDTPNHMSRPDKDRYGGLVLNLDKIAAHATNPPPARAMVVAELPQPNEPRVFVRGSPSRPGVAVPRSFLRVLSGGEAAPLGPGSGRLELARRIASPTNPLAARVYVNRVWMEHFGEPLVASPADFGARTPEPFQRELLDWLAAEFVRSGWRTKHLHRLIVASAAYHQSNHPGPGAPEGDDPWLGSFPRRRLDLESMRDTLLYVAGRLETRMGGRPDDIASDAANRRRTVYGLVDRQNLPGLFRSFDFAVPDQCVERRPRTTVPQQALFAMNSPFVQEQARAVAMASARDGANEAGRVAWLYRRVLGREPAEAEIRRALRFVGDAPDDGKTQGVWEQLAQALMVSNEAAFVD